MDADPFSLEPVTRRPVAAADVFDFDPAPAPPLPRTPSPALVSPAPPPAIAAEPAAPAEPEPHPDDLLFPGLSSRDSRRRYLEGLGAEGLFFFAPAEPVVSPSPSEPVAPPSEAPFEAVPPAAEPQLVAEPPLVAEPDESAWLEEVAVTSYAPPPAEPEESPLFADLAAPPAPVEEDLWGEEPAPPATEAAEAAQVSAAAEEPAAVQEPIATATLGEIYLRQGYLAEAERIFHEVLQHEPENAAAQAGLAHLADATRHRGEAPPLAAHQLLAGFQPSSGPAGGSGVTARKIFLLNSYLERLRQGRKGLDVS